MVESLAMDSYRYLNRITRMAVKAWIKREPYREIPWTPLRKPLAHSTVALVSSAAVAMRDDRPLRPRQRASRPLAPGRELPPHPVRGHRARRAPVSPAHQHPLRRARPRLRHAPRAFEGARTGGRDRSLCPDALLLPGLRPRAA
jgi:hypothetical protein